MTWNDLRPVCSLVCDRASQVVLVVKNPPVNQEEMRVLSLGWKDPPEEEMATHSSRRIPWTEEPGGLQSMGPQRESDTTECMHAGTYGVWTSPSPLRSHCLPLGTWGCLLPRWQMLHLFLVLFFSPPDPSNNSSSGPQVLSPRPHPRPADRGWVLPCR